MVWFNLVQWDFNIKWVHCRLFRRYQLFCKFRESLHYWRSWDCNQFLNFLQLKSWLRIWSSSVTQTLMLQHFVFINLQFAGNFPNSIVDFNLSALNGFSQKIFVPQTVDDTSGPYSITSPSRQLNVQS